MWEAKLSNKQKVHPAQIARRIMQQHRIVRYRDSFYVWKGPHWYSFTDDEIYQLAYQTTKKEDTDHEPDPGRAKSVLGCLLGEVELVRRMGGEPGLVSLENGLLDLQTGQLREHSPDILNTSSLPYAFDPDAGEPEEWLAFLHDIWPNQPEFIDTLQMWFGYNLVPETRQQKFVHLVGPPRSGKGTIATMLQAVVGLENVCRPSLRKLGERFGLESAVDKLAMIVSEGNATGPNIVDTLLNITGEDDIDIDRKFRPVWMGKLDTRITVLSNGPLKLAESHGALMARLIVLPTTKDHTGSEDHGLKDRLLAEVPAILKWSVEGWRKLQGSRLAQPGGAQEALLAQGMELDHVGVFLEDCTVAGGQTDKDEVYAAYSQWAKVNGHRPKPSNKFGVSMRAKGFSDFRPTKDGQRQPRVWVGIELIETRYSDPV